MSAELLEEIKVAIVNAIPDAKVDVQGGGGHYTIKVISTVFEGKRVLAQHRIVLSAIAPLMKGANAPLHAVDSLVCEVPK